MNLWPGRPDPRVPALLVAALTVLLVAPIEAQAGCVAPDGSNEARLMAIKSVPIAFSPARAPRRISGGSVELGVEGLTVPNAPDNTLSPTVCGGDDGLANTNQLVVAGRPRARIGVGGGLALEAGWIPPITVSGVQANLVGGSISWTSNGGPVLIDIRAHGAFGTVKGSFTCTEAETQAPSSPCFGATVSHDVFRPAVYGADITLGALLGGGKARPFLGGGYNRLTPKFDVNYTTASGSLDDSRVQSTLNRATIFGGIAVELSRAISITGQLYASLKDAATASFTLRAIL